MWQALEPVRAVRPAFGGSAINEEVLLEIFQLQVALA